MSGIQTGAVTSADGTAIGFDQSGAGPAVVLVQGALMDRADPVMSARGHRPGVAGILHHGMTRPPGLTVCPVDQV